MDPKKRTIFGALVVSLKFVVVAVFLLFQQQRSMMTNYLTTKIVRKKSPTKLVRDRIKVFIFMAGKKKKKIPTARE